MNAVSKMPSVGQYCRAHGMSLKHFNEWKRTWCPLCSVRNSFLIRPENGAYRCLECGAKGNSLIKLHSELHRNTPEQAMVQLARMAEVQQ